MHDNLSMNFQATPDIYGKLIIPRKLVSISQQQAEFIYFFLKEKRITNTLEIGLCYGCSAAHIIAATNARHIAIDPWQTDAWNDTGIKNLKLLGLYDHLVLKEQPSHIALPELLTQDESFDFAFVDGDHKFDTVMLDFYYIDKLLNMDGYVMFDDVEMDAIQKVVCWIKTNRPDYQQVPLVEFDSPANGDRTLTMFQKIQCDERNWDHYRQF